MSWKRRGWTTLIGMLVAVPGMLVWLTVMGVAQIVTTQVTDTVYRADGTAATGTVLISWPAFTNAAGQTVSSGSTSVTIATGGALSVALAPNAGATPMGTYYTAVYHLDDGTVSREFWVVPASQTPVQLNAIRSTVLPTTVAMQTVSRSYVDTAIAAAVAGHPLDQSNPYVLKAGDTMTGPLVLPGDPTSPLQAAEKQYVDTSISGLTAGLAQKVSTLPQGTQTVAQPTGSDLQVNLLNGTEYASQYVNGRGNNGIANAVTSTDCANGCEVKAEQSYASGEIYTSTDWNNQTHLEDARDGQRHDVYLNPESVTTPGTETGQVIDVTSTRGGAAVHQLTGTQNPASVGLQINHFGLGGGSNQFPQNVESPPPYFKTGYSALMVNGTYNTQGQHVLAPMGTSCYGVGDCLIGAQSIVSSGGFRDNADEGAHPFDLQVREDSRVFEGSCTAGCSTGSTSITVTPSANQGTQGDGRFLIDTNPAKVLTAGMLVGRGAGGPNASAAFSGSGFPVSTFFTIAQAIPSQANDVAPGAVTVAIATTGVPTGFATNTAAAQAQSGVACLADPTVPVNGIEEFEMANYTVVDGTHLQLTLNKAHAANATVAIGGLCGYGLEQTVDTVSGIRQVFPVIGSYSATGLYYAGGATPIVGSMGSTSGFENISLQITSVARTNNTVTLTTAGNFPVDVNGLTLTVAGVADASYNGSFAVTTISGNTLTYAQSGPNSTSTSGTLTYLTGSYALYPMAEVLSVMNPSNKRVDGTMTLAPNNVAWAANDTVEQPHYYQQKIGPDVEFVGQTVPRPSSFQSAGVQYEGNNGPGLQGWTVSNAVPASAYYGNGGTHAAPDMAYQAIGVWQRMMVAQAGEQSVFTIHCNSHGCGKWNSGYNLFELDSSVATDTIAFQPTTSSLTLNLRGQTYGFSPQGFSANTINAATVNATTLNGAVSAAQLPVFQASGSNHSQGAVPDPGATAGTTRYLREDGTWAVPAGGTAGSSSVDANLAAALLAGATADYNFLQGTGSALTDNTGNGNDGTLAASTLAPTWTPTGLSFTGQQSVALPPALNASRTFVMAVYINPLTTGTQPLNSYPILVSSSLGNTGTNLLYTENIPGVGHQSFGYAQSIYTGSFNTSSSRLTSGFHVYAYTLGAGSGSVDHTYIDGVETPYTMQGNSAGAQTSGNLFLGSSNVSPWTGSGCNCTYYRFLAYPSQLSSASVAAISASIRTEVASRGVSVSPTPTQLNAPQLITAGDSITFGLNVATPWPGLLSLVNQPAYVLTNNSIVGMTILETEGSEPNRSALLCQNANGPSIAIAFAGTNDFNNYGASAATAFSSLTGWIQTMKQAGCRVFVGTMISRTGNDFNSIAMDTDKNNYDALILQQAKSAGADGVIDFAANPLLGANGAYSNATWFQSDGIHPTQAGQQLLANAASNVLNYAFGYNESNPHTVTTLPYSMTAADGEVSLAGLTGASALTLPDCTGQSGAVYRINNPQSAYAVTVAPLNANQLINGLPFATPVTVPPNATLTLRDVPNPKTVSGCHWEM